LGKKINKSQKWAGGVTQGVGPEFKPQYCKENKDAKQRERQEESESLSHHQPTPVPTRDDSCWQYFGFLQEGVVWISILAYSSRR
jgi:hypothetical protein